LIRMVGITGSLVKDGNMEALAQKALAHAAGHDGVITDFIALSGRDIAGCRQCNWCMKKQTEDKFCAFDDGMTEIYRKLLQADAVLLASPAHFGRISGTMANMLDRLRALIHGRVYQFPLKNKVGGSLAIAYVRGGGIETTLSDLNLAFFIHQMIIATSGLYLSGAGALSSRNGNMAFEKEPRHMVLEDDFGVMSAMALVDRMIELAALVKAGQKSLRKNNTGS
jgi:multimeric flavodoxin WrbA